MTILENAKDALALLEKYLLPESHPYDVEDWLNYLAIALETMSDMELALRGLAGAFNASKSYDPDKFTAQEWHALHRARIVLSRLRGEDDARPR